MIITVWVWVCPSQRHNRCNLCCPTAAGEISYGRQTDLYGFRGPGEGVRQSSSKLIWWAMRKLGVEETCSGNV